MFILVLDRVFVLFTYYFFVFLYTFPLSMVEGNIFYHMIVITTRGQQQKGRPKI
jgi:hypothetical protein